MKPTGVETRNQCGQDLRVTSCIRGSSACLLAQSLGREPHPKNSGDVPYIPVKDALAAI